MTAGNWTAHTMFVAPKQHHNLHVVALPTFSNGHRKDYCTKVNSHLNHAYATAPCVIHSRKVVGTVPARPCAGLC